VVVVAVGMHRPAAREDMLRVLGHEVFERVEVVSHDARDPAGLVTVGRDARGLEVRLNRRVVEADCRVVTGGIAFHTIAGFSGGAKSVMPGIAAFETIQANHALAIDADFHQRPGVGEGLLAGNPVAEGILESGRLLGVDFLVNTIAAPSGGLCRVFAGELLLAHREGCRAAREIFEVPATGNAPLVIANAGGFRMDGEMYQCVKGLDNAARVAQEGGTIVFSAALEDGFGSEPWRRWVQSRDRAAIASELVKAFSFPGYIALKMLELARRHRILLVGGLGDDDVRSLGMEPAATLDEALALHGRLRRSDCVPILPAAMVTVPRVSATS
jgi:lactate racemase